MFTCLQAQSSAGLRTKKIKTAVKDVFMSPNDIFCFLNQLPQGVCCFLYLETHCVLMMKTWRIYKI